MWFDSRQGQKIFLVCKTSRPAPGPTHWKCRQFGWGEKLIGLIHPVPKLRMSGAIPLLPVYGIMTCRATDLTCCCCCCCCGRDSSIGIATSYRLDGPASNPGGSEILRTHKTSPGAHPASFAMGTGYLFRGKSGEGVALTTYPHLAPRLKKE